MRLADMQYSADLLLVDVRCIVDGERRFVGSGLVDAYIVLWKLTSK
jgi:hypothetical protein